MVSKKYKRIYLGTGSTLLGLFIILSLVGVQISSDGDKTCSGTIEDPCVSYLKIYNPTAKSVYIYNYEEVKLDFSPEIESYKLYVKYYGKWRYTNFTMETRLGNIPKDRKYVFVFPRYSTKEFKLVGYKKNPEDIIKWTLGIPGDELDPYWNSPTYGNVSYHVYLNNVEADRKYELGTTATINITTNVSGANYCVEIEDKNYTCFSGSSVFNWTVETKEYKFSDGTSEKNITSSGNVTVTLDNRTDLVNLTLNVTGNYFYTNICYQETANVSTACGGLNTGNYGSQGGWHSSESVSYIKIIDGDWGTGAQIASIPSAPYMHVNYAKPIIDGSLDKSLWQIKSVLGTINYTINQSCWDANSTHLKLKIVFDVQGVNDRYIHYQCYNGSTYIDVFVSTQLSSSSLIYEEAMWWNLTSYPSNTTISAYGQTQAVLPNKLIGNLLTQDTFIYSGTSYTDYNLSFASAGSKNIYYNVSLNRIDFNNLTFDLYGFDVDVGNDLNFFEYFNDSNTSRNKLNETTDLEILFPYWENFENVYYNDSGRWETEISNSWQILNFTYVPTDGYYYMYDTQSTYSSTANSRTGEVWTEEFDIKNVTRIDIRWYYYVGVSQWEWGTSARAKIYFSDDSTDVEAYGKEQGNPGVVGAEGSQSSTENISIRYQGSDSWKVYVDGTYKTTVTSSSLNPTQAQKIKFHGATTVKDNGVAIGASGATTDIKIYNIRLSAVTLNRTETGSDYTTNGTIVSLGVFKAPTNVSGATLEAVYFEPTGTDIKWYLTNDNRTTWQEVVVGEREAFSSDGNEIEWRAVLNTSNVNLTPIIYQVNLQIVQGTAENVTVDIGSDGTNEYNYTDKLNSSNSPQSVSINNSYTEFYANTLTGQTGLVLMKISTKTGGIINLKNFNSTQNINPVKLNTTSLEDCDNCGIEFDFTNGKLGLSDLNFSFRGSKNISIFTYIVGERDNNFTRIIQARYSKFNISLPTGIYWYDFFIEENESNATPYGQTSDIPIWNVTNLAYEDPFNVYVKANESVDSCLNYTFSNTSSKLSGFVLNTSSQMINYNVSIESYGEVWNWLDERACGWNFNWTWFDFSAICSDCVKTEDFDKTNIIVV